MSHKEGPVEVKKTDVAVRGGSGRCCEQCEHSWKGNGNRVPCE